MMRSFQVLWTIDLVFVLRTWGNLCNPERSESDGLRKSKFWSDARSEGFEELSYEEFGDEGTLRVQVPNNHITTPKHVL